MHKRLNKMMPNQNDTFREREREREREEVRKVAKIRNRYNQVPHLTQDSTWKATKTQ